MKMLSRGCVLRFIIGCVLTFVIVQPVGAIDVFNLPVQYRQFNDSGVDCVHCAIVNCLRINQQWREADYFWRCYGHTGTDDPPGLAAKLNRHGLRYKMTERGDKQFILQAIRARFCVAVGLRRQHMLNVVGADENEVVLLGNQNIQYLKRQSWSEFLRYFDGWAVIMIRPPAPPKVPAK